MKQITQIESYQKEVFSYEMRNGHTATHDIYSLGEGDKVLILIQELPGIGQETLSLADRFVERGYRVILPHLFGPLGKVATGGNFVKVLCMRKEFRVFAKNESSPVVDYLSGLCSFMKQKYNVPGVAVIGMCLTGNFAISLMANQDVLAGYASQPSLGIFSQKSIHMSGPEIELIKKNIDIVGPMHCGSFEGDKLCSPKKIKLLADTFNRDEKERIIFHTLPGKGHSVLTLDFVDEDGHPTKQTLHEVMDYFDGQLSTSS